METVVRAIALRLVFVFTWAEMALLAGFPTKWLWNWLMPALFGLKTITFWQAWGLLWLSSMLFKSSSVITTKSRRA